MHPMLQNVLNTAAPEGTAVLWWMGQMGLWIRMGNTTVSVDYYAAPDEGRQTPPPVPAEEVAGIDAFLGTHDHIDHMDHYAWKIWAGTCPEAKFVFPEAHRASVLADGVRPENALGINEGKTLRIGGVTIHAIAAAHEFLDRDPETGLYPALQYIIEGNGLRIYHAGDTLRYEGMLGKLQAFGPVDAAIVPINGRDGRKYRSNLIGNMTFQEAADLTGECGFRQVIPGHWDMFAGNTGDPEAFRDYLDAKYPGRTACRVPVAAEPIVITAG